MSSGCVKFESSSEVPLYGHMVPGVPGGCVMRAVNVSGKMNSGTRPPRRNRRGWAFSLGEYRYTRPSGVLGSGMPSVMLLPEPPVLYFSKFRKRMCHLKRPGASLPQAFL